MCLTPISSLRAILMSAATRHRDAAQRVCSWTQHRVFVTRSQALRKLWNSASMHRASLMRCFLRSLI